MRRHRRVKILATLGPSSQEPEVLEKLFEAGADIFRINMSHSSHDGMRERIAAIRAIERKHGRPIGILADLQGPKLRIGQFSDGPHELQTGARFQLDYSDEPGDAIRVQLPHPEILQALEAGHTVLVDDGKVRLRVLEASPDKAVTEVMVGGMVSNRKGVSLPDTDIPVSAMTDKDRSDLDAALNAGVDWVAVSFVQRPEDIAAVKKIAAGRALVLAKIEKPQAIQRLAEIVEISDALMVARGDLGVEMPVEKVPPLQKRITRMARRMGKPVVIATQMLESMINSPVPTRAEVSDVATAVYEGADAVMLSAESAAGQYPVEAVATMNRIAIEVETDEVYRTIINSQRTPPESTGADAIAVAAREVAETLSLNAICAWTASGSTVMRVARERPQPPILALTPNINTARRITIVWGVHAIVTKDASDIDDMAVRAAKFSNREEFSKPGGRIIIIAGLPFGTPGATNVMRIAFTGNET
jgi:pyruvate kinase